MKPKLLFLFIASVQAIFICSFLGLMAMALREDRFDHAIRIGWPKIFFTAFDAKNETLNYSGDFGNPLLTCF